MEATQQGGEEAWLLLLLLLAWPLPKTPPAPPLIPARNSNAFMGAEEPKGREGGETGLTILAAAH